MFHMVVEHAEGKTSVLKLKKAVVAHSMFEMSATRSLPSQNLPGVSGLQLQKAIKKKKKREHITVYKVVNTISEYFQ